MAATATGQFRATLIAIAELYEMIANETEMERSLHRADKKG
jgi:hypothetical protein